jgi:hypothetical protein
LSNLRFVNLILFGKEGFDAFLAAAEKLYQERMAL